MLQNYNFEKTQLKLFKKKMCPIFSPPYVNLHKFDLGGLGRVKEQIQNNFNIYRLSLHLNPTTTR